MLRTKRSTPISSSEFAWLPPSRESSSPARFQDEAQEFASVNSRGRKEPTSFTRYKFLAREHYLSDERREKRNNIDRQEEALHRHYLRVTQFLEQYVNRKAELTEGNPESWQTSSAVWTKTSGRT